mgnify:CR=1 FL=1
MRLRARKILGLALDQDSALVAEVRVSSDEAALRHVAEFRYPDGISLEDPEGLGGALQQFLREEGFKSRHVVLGLPARWLVAKEKHVPPTRNRSVAAVLRLQAEREFSSPAEDMMMDYVDAGDPSQSRPVLLVAAQRSRVKQALSAAQAAGLKVRAVSSSILALAAASRNGASSGRCVVHVRPGGAELAVEEQGRFHVLQHVPFSSSEGADLPTRLRRALALMPQDYFSNGRAELEVWDGTGDFSAHGDLGVGEVSVHVQGGEGLAGLGVRDDRAGAEGQTGRYAAAAALALSGTRTELRLIDFTHSHLNVRESKLPGRKVLWAAAAGLAVVIIGVMLVLQWRADERELADLENRLETMQPDIKEANALVDRVSTARDWYGGNPKFLGVLRELTLCFPEQGTIWASSVLVQQDMRSVVTGNAVDKQSVFEVLDKLKQSDAFADAKLTYVRQGQGNGGQVSFALSFAFVGTE